MNYHDTNKFLLSFTKKKMLPLTQPYNPDNIRDKRTGLRMTTAYKMEEV